LSAQVDAAGCEWSVLVATLLVPLFTIFHMISIAQAREWKGASSAVRSTVGALQHPTA
jgi:hypothetical protein